MQSDTTTSPSSSLTTPTFSFDEVSIIDSIPAQYLEELNEIVNFFNERHHKNLVAKLLLEYHEPALIIEQDRIRNISRNEIRKSTYGVFASAVGFFILNRVGYLQDQDAINNATVTLFDIKNLVIEILSDKSPDTPKELLQKKAIEAIEYSLIQAKNKVEAINQLKYIQSQASGAAECLHAFLPTKTANKITHRFNLYTREDLSNELQASELENWAAIKAEQTEEAKKQDKTLSPR